MIYDLNLVTSFGMIGCGNLVSYPILRQQILRLIIHEVCATIINNSSWGSKRCEYLLLNELNHLLRVISGAHFSFHLVKNLIYYILNVFFLIERRKWSLEVYSSHIKDIFFHNVIQRHLMPLQNRIYALTLVTLFGTSGHILK